MTEAVNTPSVRDIFDRYCRLDDDAKAISADKAELFKEARDLGFNPKALRKAFAIMRQEDPDAAVAYQADVETYLAALSLDLARVRVENIEENPFTQEERLPVELPDLPECLDRRRNGTSPPS